MNTDELERQLYWAERRVREIQTKLHRWATSDPHRRFDDLYNLVCDPSFLLVAWDRVRGNTGARTAGVDGQTVHQVEVGQGVEVFLDGLRVELKARSFRPLPVRERMIPKPGTTKRRRLGIPTARDRVVQASLKLVLEPIFEADFRPCSYGFRPKRRTHDAVAEVHHFASRSYEWIVEGDIKACFDEISHPALMDRVRNRIGDKRVLALVKAFLKAGILCEDGTESDTDTGTPQGGILSPVLANVALSVLDEHFAEPGIESQGTGQASPMASSTRSGELPVGPVRRRLGARRVGHQGARRGPARGSERGPIDDGFAPVAGEDLDHPYRRGLRLPWLAHPTSPEAGNQQHVLRLRLPGQEGATRRHGQDKGDLLAEHEPAARRPADPAQPVSAGLDRPLPIRLFQRDLQLPAGLHLEAGLWMAAPQTPAQHLEATPSPQHQRRMVARHSGCETVQPGWSEHHAIPLPRNTDSQPVAEHCMR